MNLDDRTILELNELCNAAVDETLTERQQKRLAELLHDSEDARRYYVRAMGLSASLHSYASESQAEHHEPKVVRPLFQRAAFWRVAGPLAAAAAVAVAAFVSTRTTSSSSEVAAMAKSKPVEYVARLTAAKGLTWAGGVPAAQPGDLLRKGQRIELAAGFAELTFDSGARLVLEGPVSLDVNSAWDTTLRRGVVKAHVPPEAIGFRVTNAAVEVVDLGTEFTMIADGNGAAEVLVLKGEIEASPRANGGEDTVLLRENESRRFADNGSSDVSDRDEKFARFTQPLALDRFSPAVNYVHWSFDETEGDSVKADVAGAAVSAAAAAFKLDNAPDLSVAHTEGRSGRALHFDGHLQAKGYFPGISGNAARTIAFWVKVPEDAQLSDAYAILTWATREKKLGNRPVGISWNRRPTEGPIGVLRTDFGGGYAMGTTSLRDGKWHHVTVYFAPGGTPDVPVQVKQYIDGRLESSTIVSSTMHVTSGAGDISLTDYVWLGCRLTGQRQREHFRGEIDELFIADRGLEPQEIVSLMNDNQMPVSGLAAN